VIDVRPVYRMLRSLLFDPVAVLRRWRGVPYFVRNASSYRARAGDDAFPLSAGELLYTSYERFASAGTASGHYFHQDLWAARHVVEQGIRELVDVGSRVDGFVAHVLPYCTVRYVDIRPLDGEADGLEFTAGSILELPFGDASVPALSCLHVIEHIGLGRYGDAVEPDAYRRAAAELQRVLAPGGVLLLGTPVGRQRVVFDAHRVFDPSTVVALFSSLQLEEFSLVDDGGRSVRRHAALADGRACDYGCGLFLFRRPPAPAPLPEAAP
jgi:SAM-dependent methyltransferase